MESTYLMKVPVCQQQTILINRQPDDKGSYRIFSGGMRAAKYQNDAWYVEPILDQGRATAKGFLSATELNEFFRQYGFEFVAFNHINWSAGVFNSGWSPLIPGQTNHMRGPADLWASIANNLAQRRNRDVPTGLDQPPIQTIASIFDNRSQEERIAVSISLSLRNMDICVEQVAEFYNEQLVNHMSSGCLAGERVSNLTLDQNLFAHVLSFFVHFGAARDYLASFCANRIGMDPQRIDDFARLAGAVRSNHFATGGLLQIFHAQGFFREKPNSSTKYEPAGWIKEASEIRNLFVHKRPFGSCFVETMGYVEPVDKNEGAFRYVRPVMLEDVEHDVQTVILRHYREMTRLCYEAGVNSGLDTGMTTIGDRDIFSARLERDAATSTDSR